MLRSNDKEAHMVLKTCMKAGDKSSSHAVCLQSLQRRKWESQCPACLLLLCPVLRPNEKLH